MDLVIEKIKNINENLPLWSKLLLGSTFMGYIWLQKKWRDMDDRGIPIITPRLLSFGTMKHYLSNNAYPEFAKKELLEKDRKTIGLYRVTTPIIVSVDTLLIQELRLTLKFLL